MMTRSIVGRFLILAVLLVSLGVIAQAALIITRGTGKTAAQAKTVPAAAASSTVAAAMPAPATPAVAAPAPAAALGTPTSEGDAAPVRVVYPGPLGDASAAPRKFVAAAPALPAAGIPAPQPVASAAPQPAPAAPVAAPAPVAPAAAKPAPVVVASADADAQPTAAPAGKGGIDLNSASVEALNRLGGGHIGQTIVKHRPYGSVEDLVKKRVVRRSVYEHIKDQVAAQ